MPNLNNFHNDFDINQDDLHLVSAHEAKFQARGREQNHALAFQGGGCLNGVTSRMHRRKAGDQYLMFGHPIVAF